MRLVTPGSRYHESDFTPVLMTAASSQSIELDEQRAELKSVLDSAQFVRAPKLALLLYYLCEKLFSGQSGQIKEYSIGVEVFARGDSFDQNADSIVRVEANRLRKRLAEYYAAEGASHRLRITIPVGQYVPEFEPASRPKDENLSVATPGESATATDARPASGPPATSNEAEAPAPGSLRTPAFRLAPWLGIAIGSACVLAAV